MTRILSAVVLLSVLIATVWFLPPLWTLVVAEVAALVAFVEYAALAATLGGPIPRVVIGAAVLAACASVGLQAVSLEIVLMTALVLVGALAVGGGRRRSARKEPSGERWADWSSVPRR